MSATFTKRFVIPTIDGWQWQLEWLETCARHAWAIGAGQLLRSENGGRNWTDVYSQATFRPIAPERIAYGSPHHLFLMGVAAGSQEVGLYEWQERQQMWSQLRRISVEQYVWCELAACGGHLWCVMKGGRGPTTVEMMDGDSHRWSRMQLQLRGVPRDIQFVSASTGWLLEQWWSGSWMSEMPNSEMPNEDRALIYRSEDGGRSWRLISEVPAVCRRCVVVDSSHLLLPSREGVIFRSDDAGESWISSEKISRVPLQDIHLNGRIGVAVGTADEIETVDDVAVMISRDGGKTWQHLEHPIVEAVFRARLTTWNSGIIASSTGLWTFEFQ